MVFIKDPLLCTWESLISLPSIAATVARTKQRARNQTMPIKIKNSKKIAPIVKKNSLKMCRPMCSHSSSGRSPHRTISTSDLGVPISVAAGPVGA